jgi:hypothetical protein
VERVIPLVRRRHRRPGTEPIRVRLDAMYRSIGAPGVERPALARVASSIEASE